VFKFASWSYSVSVSVMGLANNIPEAAFDLVHVNSFFLPQHLLTK
jgi:hypothetical protein